MPTSSITSGQNPSGLIVSGGTTIDVLSGGGVTSATVLGGGYVIVEVGGTDSGSTLTSGGSELVLGSANADIVGGLQTVSTNASGNGLVTNETIVSGGVVFLSIKNTSAANTTVDSGGTLNINGSISAFNTTISGGTVGLQSPKATLTGSLVFSGAGELQVTANTSAGLGDLAVISGFGPGDVIDITAATTVGSAGAAATSSTTVSGGNTVFTVSGGGTSDSYIFAGTAIGGTLSVVSDSAGGLAIVASGGASAVTSVGSGTTASNVVVSSGSPLTVYNGGTIVNATVLSGGTATVRSGGVDSGSTVSAGGSETVFGSAGGDKLYGTQTLSSGAVASGETVQSGGTLAVTDNTSAVNTTIAGGTVDLLTPSATLSGNLFFNGPGTLDVASIAGPGAGDQAVISGFYAGDVINITALGSGATLSTSTVSGNTVATVTSGGSSESFTFAGTQASNLALTSSGGNTQLAYAGPPTTSAYTPGDLVLSIYGDGSGTGVVGLDQAAPITLEEITTTGQIVSDQELPQTTTIVNGVTEYAISGEYESASEGLLTLAGNGQSLTIFGYGVVATAFNAANGASIYGTTALGQTTSLLGGPYTAVERVVADIGYNATVDTSTSISGVFNTNNPRSVATINGTTFYLSGQGNGTDGTEGVFLANDGASAATAIFNTRTDTRTVAIYNGQLYVSIDSKSNGGGGIYNFGGTLPTAATAPTVLQGLGASITLQAGQGNTVNGSTGTVNLSPEQYFFANANTLYVADGGVPKEGGVGDGGLQKWTFANGAWSLDYTLSTGLNLINNSGTSGTTGLVGLTGTLDGSGNVILYTSNETVAETDQTYLYGITDSLAATTLPTGESFTLLETAAPGTLIRGVAFAPTASSTVPQISSAVTVASGVISSGLTFASGGTILVQNGGTISNTTLLSSGAFGTISAGGTDVATFIGHGASELLLGSGSYEVVDGALTLSNATAVATSAIVENGGSLNLFLAGAIASGATIFTGGTLAINGRAYGDNTVISGGVVILESAKATVSGSLSFVGSGGTYEVAAATALPSGGLSFGDQALISGFGVGDAIDVRIYGAAATLATSVSSGGTNVTAIVSSGGSTETFTFAGSAGVIGASYASGLSLTSDGFGGEEIVYTAPPPIVVSSGQTSSGLTIAPGNTITVLSGGTISGITYLSGASGVVSAGGSDVGSVISAGGSEIVDGDANGDSVYGVQNVSTGPSAGASAATVENEIVYSGGTVILNLKPDVGSNITVSNGGSLLLNGNVSATNAILSSGAFLGLESPKTVINGGLTFAGPATIEVTAVQSGGFGDQGVITGWGPGDVIDETLTSAASGSVTFTSAGGVTTATISGATFPDPFLFGGTTTSNNIGFGPDGTGGFELFYQAACFAAGTRIATEAGDCAIELLAVGDLVRTVSGASRPVRWIGHRSVDIAHHPRPHEVMPVRIMAHAVAPGCPSRDLLVSPDHAIFLDDVLIPVRCLLNGATVAQESAARITWWHVELDTHDIILADGLPTETYLDTGNRAAFANAAVTDLHASFARDAESAWARHACAPLAEGGPVVMVMRERLAARAAVLGLPAPSVDDVRIDAAGRVAATLQASVRAIRLVSMSGWRGGDVRRLGALITGIRVDGVTIPLDDARLTHGFHAVESHGAQPVRWTDGAAMLHLDDAAGGRLIELDVAAVMEHAGARVAA